MAGGRPEEGRVQEQSGSGTDAEHAASILGKVNGRVAGVRAAIVRRPGGLPAWRLMVAAAGSVVIAVGAILLVIPGPGWLVIFLGLGIWATEFTWARSLLLFAKRQVRKWTAWIVRKRRWSTVLVGAAAVAVVTVVAWVFLA